MRRLNIFSVLCLCFAFSLLVACGDSNESDPTDTSGDAGHDAGDEGDASEPPKVEVDVAWSEQVGAETSTTIAGVALVGRDSVWVAGATEEDLEGSGAGGTDAFIHRYNGDGEVTQRHQFGTGGDDFATSVAVDSSGSVLVAGQVEGDLETQEHQANHREAFLRKYDVDGNLRWSTQFSTGSASRSQKGMAVINAIAVNRTAQTYAIGSTVRPLDDTASPAGGPFIRKFRTNGDVLWTRHFGQARSFGSVWRLTVGVDLDADGNVWVAWSDTAEEGGFIQKFSPDGDELLSQEIGAGQGYDSVSAAGLAVDADGNVFVSGTGKQTASDTSEEGATQALVWKFDSEGTELWRREVGPFSAASSQGLGTDPDGNIWVSGETRSRDGSSEKVMENPVIFVQKYDTHGELLGAHRVRLAGENTAPRIVLDAAGNLFVAGHTDKGTGAADPGDFEGAFLQKLTF